MSRFLMLDLHADDPPENGTEYTHNSMYSPLPKKVRNNHSQTTIFLNNWITVEEYLDEI